MWGYVFGEERKSGRRRTLKEARGRGGGEGQGEEGEQRGIGNTILENTLVRILFVYLISALIFLDAKAHSRLWGRGWTTEGTVGPRESMREHWGHRVWY